jgi:hypothetical protein
MRKERPLEAKIIKGTELLTDQREIMHVLHRIHYGWDLASFPHYGHVGKWIILGKLITARTLIPQMRALMRGLLIAFDAKRHFYFHWNNNAPLYKSKSKSSHYIF